MTLRFHIKTALAQRMFEDMQLRNFSPHTIVAYLRCVSQFAQHFNTPPDRLGPEHTRAYQQFLMQDKKVAWSTYIVAVCALRFFYDKTLHRPAMVEYMPFPKRPKTLPVILSRQEVATLLLAPSNLKHRVILATLYATGVRVAELCNLQGRDIDSGRMVIQVRQGKGQRDRQVMLSHELLPLLRYYWKRYQLDAWLFPGPTRTKPITTRGVCDICRQAGKAAKLSKRVHPHMMRHSFATHLLEDGNDLRCIQLLLGHGSLRSTSLYLHVTSNATQSTLSPLDTLGLSLGLDDLT